MEMNFKSYQSYILHNKLKNSFIIEKFIPKQCCQNAVLKKRNFNEGSIYELYKTFQKRKSFSFFPVAHARALTEEEKMKYRIRLKQYEATQKEVDTFLVTDTGKERLKRVFYKK